jgi:integrase
VRKPNLPYLEFKTVKGRTYIYFRRGKIRHRLPSDPDTEDFMREYWLLRSGRRKQNVKTTWGKLIEEFYRSPRFKEKSPGTKANYRRHCEDIREKNGDKDMSRFRRKDALRVQTALQDNWAKANERLSVLSLLCKLAVDLEWIDRNPVVDIPKLKGGEYEAWPEDMLRAYENHCSKHDLKTARIVYELAIGTGQRLGDCVKMKWSDFDGETIRVAQEKTGTHIWVSCPKRLRHFLNGLPREGSYILARNLSHPLGKRAVQKAIEDVRREIGAMSGKDRLVPHGWRYTAAKELAEAGCSDSEIQAVTGHKTLSMVQKYRAQASQRLASKRAQDRREQNKIRT